MAIVSCQEIVDGRSGELYEGFNRRYVRTFQVITDSALDGTYTVLGTPELPAYNSEHPADSDALVVRVGPSQPDRDDPYLWHVQVEYDTVSQDIALQVGGDPTNGGSQQGGQQNQYTELPLDKPPEVDWDTVVGTRVLAVTEDAPPLPVVNSAKQPFDPSVETESHDLQLTITLNKRYFVVNDADLYTGAVNSDAFQGFGIGRVKCVKIKGVRQYEKRTPYWRVTYVFLIRYPDWDVRVMDYGSVKRVNTGTGYRLETIVDPLGNPTGPVRLNGAGEPLADGAATEYLAFRANVHRTFADLELPSVV